MLKVRDLTAEEMELVAGGYYLASDDFDQKTETIWLGSANDQSASDDWNVQIGKVQVTGNTTSVTASLIQNLADSTLTEFAAYAAPANSLTTGVTYTNGDLTATVTKNLTTGETSVSLGAAHTFANGVSVAGSLTDTDGNKGAEVTFNIPLK